MNISRDLLRSKLKATGIHLCLSIAVFVYLAYLIYYVWYPQPYFTVDGGWQGIRLVGAVDLVLGPLITFLIFDPNKSRKAIMFDLVTILIIQAGALAYGIYTTYVQRPVALVLIDEFVVSSTMEQYGGKLVSADDLARYSDEKPPIIFSDFPTTHEGLAEVQRIKVEEKVLEHAQMQLYREKPALVTALQQSQMRAREWLEKTNMVEAYDQWLAANGKEADEVLIRRFNARYGVAWMVFDLEGNRIGHFLE